MKNLFTLLTFLCLFTFLGAQNLVTSVLNTENSTEIMKISEKSSVIVGISIGEKSITFGTVNLRMNFGPKAIEVSYPKNGVTDTLEWKDVFDVFEELICTAYEFESTDSSLVQKPIFLTTGIDQSYKDVYKKVGTKLFIGNSNLQITCGNEDYEWNYQGLVIGKSKDLYDVLSHYILSNY